MIRQWLSNTYRCEAGMACVTLSVCQLVVVMVPQPSVSAAAAAAANNCMYTLVGVSSVMLVALWT